MQSDDEAVYALSFPMLKQYCMHCTIYNVVKTASNSNQINTF